MGETMPQITIARPAGEAALVADGAFDCSRVTAAPLAKAVLAAGRRRRPDAQSPRPGLEPGRVPAPLFHDPGQHLDRIPDLDTAIVERAKPKQRMSVARELPMTPRSISACVMA
jgi:hypothetical protein